MFHIQTEDSGIRHPHVITHLFADGGRILKTTKTSYAEHIGQERLSDDGAAPQSPPRAAPAPAVVVPPALPAQPTPPRSPAPQKAPDAVVAAPQTPPRAPAPAPLEPAPALAPEPPPKAPPPRKPPPRPAPLAPPGRLNPALALTEPAQRAVVAQPALAEASHEPLVALAADTAASAARRRGASRPTLDVDPGAIHGVSSGEPSIDLDLDALERAAAESHAPFFQQIQDLPPPPAAVLGSKRSASGGGGYSVRSPAPPAPKGPVDGVHGLDGNRRTPTAGLDGGARAPSALGEAPRPPPQASHAGRSAPLAPPVSPFTAPSARYAPSRPASIFATTRPQEGASIFGEDLISEKSLDEVILSYLAEDLDGPGEKK
jgi:hypothetical protein